MKKHGYNLNDVFRQATIGRILALRAKDLFNTIGRLDKKGVSKEAKIINKLCNKRIFKK